MEIQSLFKALRAQGLKPKTRTRFLYVVVTINSKNKVGWTLMICALLTADSHISFSMRRYARINHQAIFSLPWWKITIAHINLTLPLILSFSFEVDVLEKKHVQQSTYWGTFWQSQILRKNVDDTDMWCYEIKRQLKDVLIIQIKKLSWQIIHCPNKLINKQR